LVFTLDGAFAYVALALDNNVAVIDTSLNQVVDTIPVGDTPVGVSITSNGALVYVTNFQGASVSVIDTITNTVIDTIAVGNGPYSLSKFIGTPVALPPDLSGINTLYAAEAGDGGTNFFTLDPVTGATQSFTDLEESLTGLAVHPQTGVFYGSIANANGGAVAINSLVIVNPATFQVTPM